MATKRLTPEESAQRRAALAERNAKIVAARRGGSPADHVARMFGLSAIRVHQITADSELGDMRKAPGDRAAQIEQAFAEGLTRKQVAQKLGLSYTGLVSYMARHQMDAPKVKTGRPSAGMGR